MMNQTLVGVFDGPKHAELARDELIQAGFAQSAVQLQQDGSGSENHEWGMGTTGQHHSGGIGGFFRSLFGFDDNNNDDDVRVYSEAARRGKCILTVDVDNDVELERAHEIINRHHPIDIDEHAAQWRNEGWSAAATTSGTATAMRDSGTSGLRQEHDEISPAPMTGSTMAGSARVGATDIGSSGEVQRVPVVQEELQVGKRTVRAGGLRVYSRLRETPVEEQVQLREERAHVERRAIDRPATEADFNQLRDGSIEVRETIEEPVVSKQARVVEEVEVGKDMRERTETVRDTVRRTEVEVEQLGEHAAASAAGESLSPTSTRPGSTRNEDLSTKAARATDKVENAIERGVDKVSGRSSKRK
jgi:uncharacterized protein (TIGR02271 family)